MNFGWLSKLGSDNGILGLLLAMAIFAIIYLYKRGEDKSKDLQDEKDKEIENQKEMIEKVTLVLSSIDNTQKALILDFEKNLIASKERLR